MHVALCIYDRCVFLNLMQQVTSHVLMIRPSSFGFNVETAENNTFQNKPEELASNSIAQTARAEFDNFVEVLRREGVDVVVVEDTESPSKPDAVFPNNWISFHTAGTIVTYPMFSVLRRQERRDDLIKEMAAFYDIQHHVHFESFEKTNQFLEGTGSLVLDRAHKICYACISGRTDPDLLQEWCQRMGYISHSFHAESNGKPIYHTNVMMAIASHVAVVCLECLPILEEREALKARLAEKHAVVEITHDQVQQFAGNMLALKNRKGEELMVMSERAYQSLTTKQKYEIGTYCRIVSAPIQTIEDIGGGSARCMIAEIFLHPK